MGRLLDPNSLTNCHKALKPHGNPLSLLRVLSEQEKACGETECPHTEDSASALWMQSLERMRKDVLCRVFLRGCPARSSDSAYTLLPGAPTKTSTCCKYSPERAWWLTLYSQETEGGALSGVRKRPSLTNKLQQPNYKSPQLIQR